MPAVNLTRNICLDNIVSDLNDQKSKGIHECKFQLFVKDVFIFAVRPMVPIDKLIRILKEAERLTKSNSTWYEIIETINCEFERIGIDLLDEKNCFDDTDLDVDLDTDDEDCSS